MRTAQAELRRINPGLRAFVRLQRKRQVVAYRHQGTYKSLDMASRIRALAAGRICL